MDSHRLHTAFMLWDTKAATLQYWFLWSPSCAVPLLHTALPISGDIELGRPYRCHQYCPVKHYQPFTHTQRTCSNLARFQMIALHPSGLCVGYVAERTLHRIERFMKFFCYWTQCSMWFYLFWYGEHRSHLRALPNTCEHTSTTITTTTSVMYAWRTPPDTENFFPFSFFKTWLNVSSHSTI